MAGASCRWHGIPCNHPIAHRILTVRAYLNEWDGDVPPDLFLERVGAEGSTPPPMTDSELARRITRAGDWIENNIVFCDETRRIALLGVDDLIVVQTGDAILIANRHQADNIKKLVDELPDEFH